MLRCFAIAGILVLGASMAQAADSNAGCEESQKSCVAKCNQDHPNDALAEANCITECARRAAACGSHLGAPSGGGEEPSDNAVYRETGE